jgi:antitoxin ParD1/3/4
MPTRVAKNISITPELLKFVQAQIATGRYQNSSEVMRAALRALEREELVEQERRTRLSSAQVRS